MNIIKNLFSILSQYQKRQTYSLFLLILIGVLLEAIGVGLIVPILVLITEENVIDKYPFMYPIMDWLGFPSQNSLVVMSMLLMVTVIALKVTYLLFLAWRKATFSSNIKAYLSKKLFSFYLMQPYTFHLQHNSASLIRNISSDVSAYNRIFESTLSLVSELLIFVVVIGLLAWVEPTGTLLVMAFLIGVGLLFYKTLQKKLSSWGKQFRSHAGLSLQHIQQGLGGVKEIKVLGREKIFEDSYAHHMTELTNVEKKFSTLSAFPRLWFELLVVVGLSLLILSAVAQGKSSSELVPILGLFAVAAFRLMPSLSRIFSALQNVQYNKPAMLNLCVAFLKLKSEVDLSDRKLGVQLKGKWSAICLSRVGYRFPSVTKNTLHDISIKINHGDFIGVIGSSGSGKSTLVDVIIGLLPASEGSVCIDDMNLNDCVKSWQKEIGYIPQSIYLTDDSIRRNIAFGIPDEEIDDLAISHAVNAAQLNDYINSLESDLDTKVGEHGIRLSGGQRQRIGIARALYHNPSVLILDEATSALDVDTEQEVMSAINALHGEKTVVIIAHRLSTIANCDWVYKLENGRVIKEGIVSAMVGVNS